MIWLLKNWKLLLGGLALAYLGISLALAKADARHERKLRIHAEESLVRFAADVSAAREKAKADDLAHARAVEAKNEAIRQEKARDLETKLADARALANAYLARLRNATPANPGGGGQPDMSGTGHASGPADVSGEKALVDASDILICTENTTLLEGWQSWFSEIQKTRNDR